MIIDIYVLVDFSTRLFHAISKKYMWNIGNAYDIHGTRMAFVSCCQRSNYIYFDLNITQYINYKYLGVTCIILYVCMYVSTRKFLHVLNYSENLGRWSDLYKYQFYFIFKYKWFVYLFFLSIFKNNKIFEG